MKRFRFALVGALVSGLLVGIPLTEAGAAPRKKAAARIRASVSQTRDQGTASLEGTVTTSSGGRKVTMHVDGVVDLGLSGDAVLHFDGGDAAPFDMDARLVDGIAYFDFGGIFDAAGEDRPAELEGVSWLKLDLSSLIEAAEQGTTPPGSSNPANQLDVLRGVVKGSIETVGTEVVVGVETTHYRAEVDADKAIEQLPEEFKEEFADIPGFEESLEGFDDFPIDVWIDGDGIVRRQRTRTSHTVDGKTVKQTTSFEYVGFGVPLDVEAPPEEEVFDFQEFFKLVEEEAA
jgi:hypothetical protein